MILIMGVAGAGKSLQGRWLADEAGLPWISTGEFLRMMVSGERRKQMVQGSLLADTDIIRMADKIIHLLGSDEEFILDGFPRTTTQAEWLISQRKVGLFDIKKVILIDVDKEVVTERLLERGRPDDNMESINNRFEEFKTTTLPIVKDLADSGVEVLHINGDQTPEEVHQDILNGVNL